MGALTSGIRESRQVAVNNRNVVRTASERSRNLGIELAQIGEQASALIQQRSAETRRLVGAIRSGASARGVFETGQLERAALTDANTDIRTLGMNAGIARASAIGRARADILGLQNQIGSTTDPVARGLAQTPGEVLNLASSAVALLG